jgi:TatD DNase family protein
VTALVDTHAHIQGTEFDTDREAVIGRARAAGVQEIIVPAVDIETAVAAIELADRHMGIYATAGFHPHEASRAGAEALATIGRLLEHPKVVAVGEIGLDFYYDHSPREAQIETFEAHLELAATRSLPVIIHCRDAWDALRPLLEPWAHRVAPSFAGRPLGVLHYFSSTLEDARLYRDLGFVISVHTSITHKKAGALRDVVSQLPLDALVIETDSPYGAPQAYRGKRNEPAYVVEAAQQVAALHNTTVEAVAAATTANARRLFGLGVSSQTAMTGAAI